MKNRNEGIGGYLLFHKEPGLTSFDSLAEIKKALGTSRIGHTGTLDKFAGGLLVILAGRCTKLIPWFLNCSKTYEALICFGSETDTLDPEGAIIKRGKIPSRQDIEAAIPRFTGPIMQAPPVYSSIHINGKRASALARAGKEPVMAERPVIIHSLSLESYEDGKAAIRVACSKGTYIRSLARDLAAAAGSCGYLVYLKRTGIAGFSLDNALGGVSGPDGRDAIRQALKPIDRGAFQALDIPCIEVDDTIADQCIHGRPINGYARALETGLTSIKNDTSENIDAALFRKNGVFAGIIQRRNGSWQYGYVYAGN